MDNEDENDDPRLIVLSQKAVWYHQGDVSRFKHEVQVYARLVMSRERHVLHLQNERDRRDKPVWSQTMWEAYQGLYKATTLDEMNVVMENARSGQQPMDAMCLGLEKWALGRLRNLKAQQRRALVRAIVERQFQEHLGSDKQLRRLSRDLSRPSRLFAAYVGRAVQQTEENPPASYDPRFD